MKRINVKEFCLSLLLKFSLKSFQVCPPQDIYLKGRGSKTIDLSENPSKSIIPPPGAAERKIRQIIIVLEQNAV